MEHSNKDMVVHMTENTQKYVINAGLFGAVGTLWAGAPSSISPFQYGKIQVPGTEEKQALSEAGICDAGGQILAAARPALDVLGTAHAFTRVYLSGSQIPSEFVVYFAPNGAMASLINSGGDMQINFPAAADLFVEMVAQGIGSSIYHSVPFEATLTPDEGVVLAGMIDLQRKQALKSIADEQASAVVESDLPTLLRLSSRKVDNTQWLSNVLLDLLSLEGILSIEQVRAAAESLVQKGYALKNPATYRLSDVTLALARRMLIFDTALTLTSGYVGKSGALSVVGFTCLQAGIHDLLLIDAGEDAVTLQSVSSAGIIDSVQTYFTDLHTLEKMESAPGAKPAVSSQRRKFCPQCGSALPSAKKFCPQCGAKIS